MNNEENQGFTSFDFITMMVSFVVIAAVTGPIIRKNIQSDQSVDRARIEAANLGRALLDPNRLPSMASGSDYTPKADRSIASLNKAENVPKLDMESLKANLKKGEMGGNISKDPWGNPYHYTFLRNAKGQTTYLAVWSDGSDGPSKNATSVGSLISGPDKVGEFEFNGKQPHSIIPIR